MMDPSMSVSLLSLSIPILASAAIVFVASSIFHMVLTHHRNDMRQLPNEGGVLDALRPFSVPPGDYVAPYAGSPEAMKSPAYIEKQNRGPVVMMTVVPNGPFSLGKSLVQWFLYCVLVSALGAYIAGSALGPGASYLAVFRYVGTAALLGYSVGLLQQSIWYMRNWGATLRSVADGVVYALLTAGTFGWLWP